MGFEGLYGYNVTQLYFDRQLDIWGEPCTVYIPDSRLSIGDEDLPPEMLAAETGVADVGTRYMRVNTKCFINFQVTRSVLYHFNWFPEDADELAQAFFPFNDVIREDSFIRTAQNGHLSKYGDLVFKIVEIKDDGVYQTLKRIYFCRQVSDATVRSLLPLGDTGIIHLAQVGGGLGSVRVSGTSSCTSDAVFGDSSETAETETVSVSVGGGN